MRLAGFALVIATLVVLAGCTSSLPNPNGPNQPPIEAAITSFGANPNPVPQNIATQFSWSVVGVDLTCRLDVDNNGTVDYTVQGCTSASRVAHQYPEVGKYTARLTITAASGETRSETTGVEVGIANQAPIPNLKLAVPSNNTDPLAVRFSWVVSDQDADITRCQLDAEGDGSWEYDGLCAGLSAQSVGPSDLVSYYFEYTYIQQGQYTAVLQASDAYQSNSATVVVRVPLNKPPVIEHLGATVENGRLKVNYRVSDPDGDAVACVLKIDGVGRFAYDDCRTPFQTYPTMGQEKFEITLEASDPYQTTRRFLKYQGDGCKSFQASDWSTDLSRDPELPNQIFGLDESEATLYTALAISPDCRLVVSATVSGQLKMWNYGSFDREPVVFGEGVVKPGFVERLLFSPDSRYLVVSGCVLNSLVNDAPSQASIWDLSGQAPRQLSTSFTDQTICSSAYSPDGSTLALGTFGLSGPGKILLMRGDRPTELKGVLEMEAAVMALAYSPNGNVLAVSDVLFASTSVQDPPIDIPELPGLARLKTLNGGVKSTEDTNFLSGITALKLYDGRNPTVPVFSDALPPIFAGGAVVNVLEFSPDGGYLAGSSLAFVYSVPWLISMQNDTPQDFFPLNLPTPFTLLTGSLSISPDGQWLAVPSYIGALPTMMYSLRSQSVEGMFASGLFNAFSPDNRRLFGGPSGVIGNAIPIFDR